MLVVTGYLDFDGLDPDEVVEALATVTELSRQDQGCVEYWWAQDLDRPARFRFFECWESRALFDEHRAQPYEDGFLQAWVSRCSGADVHVHEVTGRSRQL